MTALDQALLAELTAEEVEAVLPDELDRVADAITRHARSWRPRCAGGDPMNLLVTGANGLDDPVLNVLGGQFCAVPLGSRMQ